MRTKLFAITVGSLLCSMESWLGLKADLADVEGINQQPAGQIGPLKAGNNILPMQNIYPEKKDLTIYIYMYVSLIKNINFDAI